MKLFYAVLLLMCAASLNAAAHTSHTSLTRIDYNAETKSAEITIQTFAHDFEEALAPFNNKKRVNLDKTVNLDEIVLKYLAAKFVLKNAQGETQKLAWVGTERKNDAVWLYVETAMPAGLAGATLANLMLFESHNDQINWVSARFDNQKVDLVFRPSESKPQKIAEAEAVDKK